MVGETVTFTATVMDQGAGAKQTPTGSVTFYDGSTMLGIATLSTAVTGTATASFSISTLALGGHPITAVYDGDATFNTGLPSAVLTQNVNQDGTTTTVTSPVNPSAFGQDVTLTATVVANAPGSGTPVPTGTVTFMDTGTVLGTATLSGGTATFDAGTGLTSGSHDITAVYNGDTNYSASTSADYFQTVSTAPTTTSLAASTLTANTAVTFTATVNPVNANLGTPTGTVTFYIDGTYQGAVALNGNQASFLVTGGLKVGKHTIVAVYSGDGDFSSSSVSQTDTFSQGRGG